MKQDRLKHLFRYENGFLIWVNPTSNRAKVGAVCGAMHADTYLRSRVDKRLHLTHRLIWIFHYGEIPDGTFIDHINEDKTDNRIENLRLATKSQNMMNRGAQRNNSTGIKGVSITRDNTYLAQCRTGSHVLKKKFKTLNEAVDAVRRFRTEHHKEFANHG